MKSGHSSAKIVSSTVKDYLTKPAFSPRQFTRNEFTAKDLYITYSPRQERVICVEGVAKFGKWLLFEFDPSIAHCVERPRSLELDERRHIELDFWTREKNGEETFWALLSQDETRADLGGRAPKEKLAWEKAADAAGIRLRFIIEEDLLVQSTRIANYFRMLSHVQASRRISHRMQIKSRIHELVFEYHKLSFRQIDASLNDFPAKEVRAVTCSLIHGGSLFIKERELISDNTFVYVSLQS